VPGIFEEFTSRLKELRSLEEALVTLEFLFLLILRIPLRISPLFPLPPSPPLLESLMVNLLNEC